jgi:probable rRNA maturation factor
MGSSGPLITFRRVPEHAGFDREQLESFARKLQVRVTGGREFHCRITGDTELRRLNGEFLGKDYATDVLSFPDESSADSIGDLAISRQRAAAQAREFGHTLTKELQLLMLHGVLHLTGMDHETDHGEMSRAEERWRDEFNLPQSLTRRSLTKETARA